MLNTLREHEFPPVLCTGEEHTFEYPRHTVVNHRIALFEKFAIKSKTGLVLFAMRWGLVPMDN